VPFPGGRIHARHHSGSLTADSNTTHEVTHKTSPLDPPCRAPCSGRSKSGLGGRWVSPTANQDHSIVRGHRRIGGSHGDHLRSHFSGPVLLRGCVAALLRGGITSMLVGSRSIGTFRTRVPPQYSSRAAAGMD